MTTPPDAGPRIDPLTPDEAAHLLGETRPLNIFLTLARNEDLFTSFLSLGSYLLSRKGTIPRREREIVILRVGWRCGSDYEFGQHTLIGKHVGLTDDEIGRLATQGLDGWSGQDAALVAMSDELCRDDVVSDATWARLAEQWSQPQLLELLVLAGFYRLVSGFLRSVGVQREPGTPGFPDGAQPRVSR
ncbi:MAG TPA: carboxymuconolactone decarboxylase family protein [Mycobacteriales bacterium]|nr:carboxymuconolactone decarboxylase family protein [Mycobacteriales bacterium]